jgi:GxxExxY protein
MDEDGLNRLAKAALDAVFAVHSELGPGLLESTYKACLAYELSKRGVRSLLEVPMRWCTTGRSQPMSVTGSIFLRKVNW